MSRSGVMNFGRSSTRDHCSYTRLTGAFTTTNCRAAFIAGCAAGAGLTDRIKVLDREARILLPGKNPVPSVGEVKQSHVEHEHPVVTLRGTAENPPQGPLGIALEVFGFHF